MAKSKIDELRKKYETFTDETVEEMVDGAYDCVDHDITTVIFELWCRMVAYESRIVSYRGGHVFVDESQKKQKEQTNAEKDVVFECFKKLVEINLKYDPKRSEYIK